MLPDFRCVPDPVGAGVVEPSTATCPCCGRATGWACTGPVLGADELEDGLCPWCVADGSAAARGATFTSVADAPPDVPASALDEVHLRTPGPTCWQAERWLFHCGDACAYLGPRGWAGLADLPDAVAALRQEHEDLGWSAQEADQQLRRLDAEGSATAYLFRCLHCGRHLAYSDVA